MHLMDGSPVAFVHLVKLINAADALVSQHQSAAFEHLHLRQAPVGPSKQHWLKALIQCCLRSMSSQTVHQLGTLDKYSSSAPAVLDVHHPW